MFDLISFFPLRVIELFFFCFSPSISFPLFHWYRLESISIEQELLRNITDFDTISFWKDVLASDWDGGGRMENVFEPFFFLRIFVKKDKKKSSIKLWQFCFLCSRKSQTFLRDQFDKLMILLFFRILKLFYSFRGEIYTKEDYKCAIINLS